MTTVAPRLSEFARSLSPRKNSFPARPVFDDIQDERQLRKQRLAAALQLFGKLGYNEGAAGHITVRDPELPDHFWVNPFGRAFSRIEASELLLVNHDGEIVHGDHPVNQAAFAIHSQIHQARPTWTRPRTATPSGARRSPRWAPSCCRSRRTAPSSTRTT